MVNIKVAVRIRPLSQRELIQGDEIVVRKESKSVVVTNPKIPERQDGDSRRRSRRFSVDFCYDPEDPEGCSQEAVYNEIGSEVLRSMFEGYNACVLAYGHSASGKTYTIMGLQDDPGLTPRLCQGLFQRVDDGPRDEKVRVEVSASFLEIYNEKVKDLLGNEESGATCGNFSLRVREHPKLGPYVQGLSEHLVTDRKALLGLLTAGNSKRSTAATENNIHSSRSHAVFTIHFRQSDGEKCETEKWSKVHLVDLAGSLQEVSHQESPPDERATSAQSKARLQEGANINKSLVTLGNVISALAESLETSAVQKQLPGSKSWQPFVPYRDSVLTWLLKDTLGGNSNTIMIAIVEIRTNNTRYRRRMRFGDLTMTTISPASGCLSETVNTLRYAKRTKRIVNQAIVNEDPKVRIIRELRREIARLKSLLLSVQSVAAEGYDSKELLQKWLAKEGMSERRRSDGGGEEKQWRESAASRGSIGGHGAASVSGPPAGASDEKQSVVNGSANDTFSHESQIFSDSLESLASVFIKSGTSCDVENGASGGAPGGTEFGSCEILKRKESAGMLHRSRPDLIKGISARFKERLPSTSSQSCTDVSNLSQSTSENSLNSSGSIEVQSLENRPPPDPGGRKNKEEGQAPKGSRSRIVEAVTTRLYVAKKRPDHRVKAVGQKESEREAEELKLCKRARMKLFDLSRKMALTRRTKRTVDSDTQTESVTGTVRVKEKCVETDLGEVSDDEADGPSSSQTLRVETVQASGRQESATQTVTEEKSDKSANTSPVECSPRDEECFSDDSLDSVCKRKNLKAQEGTTSSSEAVTCENGVSKCFGFFGESKKQNAKVRETTELLFNGLPLSVFTDADVAAEQRSFVYTAAHPSCSSSASGKEENLSSDSSFTSADGTEFVSSSEASSEDFIFYENPKENSGVGTTPSRNRELYTITENSEQSDPSDAFSPVPSQSYSLNLMETNGTERRRNDSSGSRLRAKEFVDYEIAMKSPPRLNSTNSKDDQSEGSKNVRAEGASETAGGLTGTEFCAANVQSGSKSRRIGAKEMSAGSRLGRESEWRNEERMAEKSASRYSQETWLENPKEGDLSAIAENGIAETKKTKWADWHSNSEKQYLNLNISNGGRAPFSIDTHIFGKEWKKEQSIDAMFTSADSLTLVFMGPAKPKSSVLMEIIRRSLGSCSSGETPSVQKKSKSRGVQCDANLVRSVSVDTAMIALSKIARNQEQSPNITRTTSLSALDPYEMRATTAREKGDGHRETSCQSDIDLNDFKTWTKKSALKCSVGTETTFYDHEGNAFTQQKKREDAEKPKKSVSWFEETKHDVEAEYESPEQSDDREPPNLVDSFLAADEDCHSDRKISLRKAELGDVKVEAEHADDFTTFLKEAIFLLKKINSSSSRYEVVPEDEEKESEVEVRKKAEETEKGTMRRAKKVELVMRSKTENRVEKEEGGRTRGWDDGRSDGNGLISTWPRRRAASGKPPTGIRGRVGRSAVGGRLESFHSAGLLDRMRNCRSGSGGISWCSSRSAATLSGASSCLDEIQSKTQSCRFSYGDESKWDEEVSVSGLTSPRLSVSKANMDSLLEAEMDLENCCRSLELAVERDKMREKISEMRQARQEWTGLEEGFPLESRHGGIDRESDGEKARTRVQRRMDGDCAGTCTCRTSPKDPCKHLLTEGCQSSFELDSFGPGSKHCHQFCIFCRKKNAERYSSALDLNSECLSDLCRLKYYGYCPCSSVRLERVASSPRAYMRHLLTLRRQIVGKTAGSRGDPRDLPEGGFTPRPPGFHAPSPPERFLPRNDRR